MKIYTKTGDQGTTSLFDGTRVAKDHARIDTYGDVDELNSFLGILKTEVEEFPDVTDLILQIQRDLFAMGAQLANPAHKKQKEKADFTEGKITVLEKAIDSFEAEIEPITNFMLPGGSRASASAEFARTLCRRAERKVVALARDEEVPPLVVIYLNRLSDLLFMMARVLNKRKGIPDIPWKS